MLPALRLDMTACLKYTAKKKLYPVVQTGMSQPDLPKTFLKACGLESLSCAAISGSNTYVSAACTKHHSRNHGGHHTDLMKLTIEH